MKQIKHMTKTQLLRIQLNNYYGEHDRTGSQFDYEAKGYRGEIDARLWELSDKKVNDMMKQARTIYTVKQSADKTIIAPVNMIGKADTEKTLIEPKNEIRIELDRLDLTISVNKTFFKWRNISNELMIKIV